MIIKPFTFIAFLLFVLSGAYLFGVKFQSQTILDKTSAAVQATKQDEEDMRVLQAQWALEAAPPRLAELAAQFTQLQPMKPAQLTTLDALASALPAPGSAAPGPNPENEVPAMPQLAQAAAPAPAAAPVAVAAAAPAVPAPAAPPAAPVVQTAAAAPAPAAPAAVPPAMQVAAAVPVAAKPRKAPERMASVETLLHNLPTAHHARLHHSSGPREEVASADLGRSELGYTPVAEAPVRNAVPVPAPVAAPQDGGSLLGMASGGGN